MKDDEAAAFLQNLESEQSPVSDVIRVVCPTCQKQYKLSSDKAGKRVKCTNCETLISVPGGTAKRKQSPKSLAQAPSVSYSQDNESDLKKIGAVIVMVVSLGMGTYRLIIRPLMNHSRYSEAERLTVEAIQEMNAMADLVEGMDFTKEISPNVQRKMDASAVNVESITRRLLSLKLTNDDRLKLKRKHGQALDEAKSRFDRAMARQLKRAFSQINRRK